MSRYDPPFDDGPYVAQPWDRPDDDSDREPEGCAWCGRPLVDEVLPHYPCCSRAHYVAWEKWQDVTRERP